MPGSSSIWFYSPTRDMCCSTDSQSTEENTQKAENRLHQKQNV